MKRLIPIIAILSIVWALPALAATPHTGNPGGNCDGYNGPTKVDTSDGSIVLPAGTILCIKAGDSNTGTIVADGKASLADLIEASGLLNNGGQVPNVSNYVTYGVAPTTSPTTSPTETPIDTPTPVPTDTPDQPTIPTMPPTDTL